MNGVERKRVPSTLDSLPADDQPSLSKKARFNSTTPLEDEERADALDPDHNLEVGLNTGINTISYCEHELTKHLVAFLSANCTDFSKRSHLA